MVLFHNMNEVTIDTAVLTLILLLFSVRMNPVRALGSLTSELKSPKFLLHFAAVIGILYVNKMELIVEKKMNPQPDFTPFFYKLEGNFVADFQHLFQNEWLTAACSFFYIVVFPTLMIASIVIYTLRRNPKLFYALCYGLLINYIVAIPFYLFFPVSEAWTFQPNVHFLMNQTFPTFETDYRPLSGIDNCFPSLHTSISVTLAIVASRCDSAFWRRFTAFSAAFIIFSIFYLGVHWLTDMCGGLLLAAFAGRTALRLSESRTPLLRRGSLLAPSAKLTEKG